VPRILLIGLNPDTVDFSDPSLPPGMTAEQAHAGIALSMKSFAERGWHADICYVTPDKSAAPTVTRMLASARFDCVVIGGGLRLPARNLEAFEAVVNAVRQAAPGVPIAFNTRPDNSAEAAARWLTGKNGR